ncbi:two-component sensor histidine kinase [Leptospira perolatii]|uniref:histidine kinase n=1 Tax=Leptospira perolatii TaxID=2023191 RepID=A0A2M9ZL37_9LEPT|nr:HAMP domain-containing sensor histidine kinase [Leptospira perolatii]PJZ69939.1 two-component sensor histidine kinase [Leptospira perolatii]PJZ72653.1 two-component sensor histidine kinase [Leptospira perolatii]
MRRSLFSKLLLSNWSLLLFLMIVAGIVLYLENKIPPDLKILLFSTFVILAMFCTFYASFSIAKSVTVPLNQIENKTGEINAGDFGSELTLPEIKELADLTVSINRMSARLKNQFVDLTIEKEKFDSVLQNLKEGVFSVDPEGSILFQNRSIPSSLIEPNSGSRKVERAVKDERLLEFIKKNLGGQGEPKTELALNQNFYAVKMYPLRTNGNILMFICVIRNVTEEKQSHLIREQFVQNASHELKTPITSIKGYTETLLGRLKLNADSHEKKFLDAISRNTDRMVRIVEDMLTITRIENQSAIAHPEEFTLKSLVDNLSFTVEGVVSAKQQKFVVDMPEPVTISADWVLLEHMLLNLISNASAYSPEGKTITLKISKVPDNFIQFQVIDQGIGINDEDKSRIFERFFRVDKNRSRKEGGTGLGLSIVKHIVRLHHGTVKAIDNPEGGSIFSATIPKVYVENSD